MQHYDRSTIQEIPIPANVVIVHQRPRRAPVMDAELMQRDQLTTRMSLRRLK